MKPTRSQWNKREMHNEITIISYKEIICGGKSCQTIEFNFVSNPNPTVRAVSQLLVCVLPALPFHADGAFVSMQIVHHLLRGGYKDVQQFLRQIQSHLKESNYIQIVSYQDWRNEGIGARC